MVKSCTTNVYNNTITANMDSLTTYTHVAGRQARLTEHNAGKGGDHGDDDEQDDGVVRHVRQHEHQGA